MFYMIAGLVVFPNMIIALAAILAIVKDEPRLLCDIGKCFIAVSVAVVLLATAYVFVAVYSHYFGLTRAERRQEEMLKRIYGDTPNYP